MSTAPILTDLRPYAHITVMLAPRDSAGGLVTGEPVAHRAQYIAPSKQGSTYPGMHQVLVVNGMARVFVHASAIVAVGFVEGAK